MVTIFEAAASANRLSASLAKLHQPQFTLLSASLAKAYQPQFTQAMAELAKLHQPQLTLLSQAAADLAKLHQPQFTLLSQAIARTYQPLLDAVLALERLDYDSLNTKSAFSSSDRLPQSLTDREIAAMLTVAAFLVVYISFGLLIKHSAQAARLAAIDGPTPFEAAMAVGALVFWLWMNRSRGSNDK